MNHLEKRSAVFMQEEKNQRMPRGKRIAIIYGTRQTPSPAVLDPSLAFSALKFNASARKSEWTALESMAGDVHVLLRELGSSRMKEFGG